MEFLYETALDDVLTRSQRLDMRTPFKLHQSIHSLIQDSQALLKSNENIGESESDATTQTAGQLLLAQENVDVSRTPEILKHIQVDNACKRRIQSFKKHTEEELQADIIASINETEKVTDKITEDFILNSIANEWEKDEAAHHYSRDQSSFTKNLSSMPIVPRKVEFFSQFLKERLDISNKLASAIMDPSMYVDAHSLYLSDTFNLIDKMYKSKRHYKEAVISFLEDQMKRIIVYYVNGNLANLERGGEIGIIPTIITFVRAHFGADKSDVNHWCVVYFALRCGLANEALNYVRAHPSEFPKFFLIGLGEWKHGRVDNVDLLNEYRITELNNADYNVFKVMVLAVILGEKPTITDLTWSIEDWIWIRLHVKGATIEQLNEELDIENNVNTGLTIETIRSEEVDASHTQQNPFLRGQLEIMCASFDKACKSFLSQEDNIDENIHIAIVLHVTGFVSAGLISKSVLKYAEQVYEINKETAVKYIATILDQKERRRCIALLAVEVENGRSIYLPMEGRDQKPIQHMPEIEDQQESVREAGQEAEARDQHKKAAQFYMLSGDYEKIVSNCCIELRQCIEGFVDSSAIEDSYSFYNEVSSLSQVSTEGRETLRALLNIAAAKTCLDEKKFAEASRFVDSSNLFPQNHVQIPEYIERIRVASKDIRSIYATAIEIAMHAYSELYRFIQQGREGDSYTNSQKQISKEKGDALQELSGSIDIDVNQETQYRILNYHNLFK